MKKLSISIIITILNESQTIEKLLLGLLHQTYKNFEVILVDGGSSDNTGIIIQKLRQQMPSLDINFFIKKGNRSVGRNFAIQKAKNDLIAITDAGCIPLPEWLEKLVTKYQETGAEVTAGFYTGMPETIFQEAVIPYALVMPDQVNAESFLPATRSMLLTKKSWVVAGKFDESLNDNEDFAFAHALVENHIKMEFAGEAIVKWIPPSSLKNFSRMIFRFARGDIFAGILRPKVIAVFLRYLVLLILIFILINQAEYRLLSFFLLLGSFGYSAWAITKNYRYAKKGWYWLPLLQYTADAAVLSGSTIGFFGFLNKNLWSKDHRFF